MQPNPTNRPIGVFDSGVGGLTVLEALQKRLPKQDFIYIGDTARVPYGRKPREMVRGFARGISAFLLRQNVSAIVIACNTASAAALPDLAADLPVPVWGVIDPGVEAARRRTKSGRVGVIGTKGTIAAGAYQRKLEALGLTVCAQACPLFVHLVEEGLSDSPEAEVLARHYLGALTEIDTLILGCTHYPLLRPVIQRVMGDSVSLVSSADVTADLVAASPVACGSGSGNLIQYVTGDPASYRHTASFIDGIQGDIVPLDVTKLD